MIAVNAWGSFGWTRIDRDVAISIYTFDLKVRYTYDGTCVGHRCYLH